MRAIITLFLFISISFSALAQADSSIYRSIESNLEQYLVRSGAPSASVAVARSGKIEWVKAIGEADKDQRYPFASVTKSITATAILLLAKNEQLQLDDLVADHLESNIDYPDPRWSEVTVRHLMNHTSGLGMYYRVQYEDQDYPATNIKRLIEEFGFLHHTPGTRFEYANLGYAILGKIIESVSGQSYGDYLATQLFKPLGMMNTGIRDKRSQSEKYVPLFGVNGEPLPYVYTDTEAAGDLYGTASDLARFGSFHLGFGAKTLLAELPVNRFAGLPFDRSGKFNDPCQPYDLGWYHDLDSSGHRTMIWHDGGLDGANSTLRLFPNDDLVIAVMTNITFTVGAADSVAAIVQKALTKSDGPATCPTEETGNFRDNEEWIGKWTGFIRTAKDSISINLDFREDGEIVASFFQPQSNIIFIGEATFPLRVMVDQVFGTTNHLIGWIPLGIIDHPDLASQFHIVQLDLRLTGDQVSGVAKAFTANTGREGFGISFPIELKRQE